MSARASFSSRKAQSNCKNGLSILKIKSPDLVSAYSSDDQVLSLYEISAQRARQSNDEVRFPERYACRDLQYVLSPQLLMIPRREKEVPRQYRFLRYAIRRCYEFFFFLKCSSTYLHKVSRHPRKLSHLGY